MKKILILGATGMLGNAVTKYFLSQKDRYNITVTARDVELAKGLFPDIKIIQFRLGIHRGCADLITEKYDYVINCIGTIKPFMQTDAVAARYINAIFPWELANVCTMYGAKLLHITTDCVFSGKKGKYIETDLHDALDDYGKSKSLGEPISDCMVIRTSIIGEEVHKNASLIEWAKSQRGKKVKGFTHHQWNGITTTQYGKVCDTIMTNEWWERGLFHVHSKDDVNKFQMMTYFNEKFDLKLEIEEVNNIGEPCDRTMRSSKPLNEKLNIPTVREQIQAL